MRGTVDFFIFCVVLGLELAVNGRIFNGFRPLFNPKIACQEGYEAIVYKINCYIIWVTNVNLLPYVVWHHKMNEPLRMGLAPMATEN